LLAGLPEEIGNRIFYGLAKEGMVKMFRLFDTGVHCVPDEAIPAGGTNYMFIDPAGRNFFITWVRVFGRNSYVYREWPGNYEVPGQGMPGPWAVPDGKLGDGRRGPAQESFGFGLIDYKVEIARLEGWADFKKQCPADVPWGDFVEGWFPENGARERVLRRFIDSRFASTPHQERDRPVTMLENFARIGLFFEPTPGDDILEGVQGINDMLRYDTTRKIDALNCPRLFVAKSCTNTIFALRTWRNSEGRKGATKDPVDNLRYFALADCGHVPPEAYESSGGGYY
jgi:hypothetical protein